MKHMIWIFFQVLKILGYIDENENVQLKGAVAREMSNHELLITELLVKSCFTESPPEEVAALLSCMVFQQKNDDANLELPSHMIEVNMFERLILTMRNYNIV